jgi:sugar phosphate isomerase/epimerase
MFQLGYNTNGFAHHRLMDAIEIIGQLGYRCVAITLDHSSLNPWGNHFAEELQVVKSKLTELGLSCVIETGSRFMLNPWKKHDPTLISDGGENRLRRIDFLKRAIDIAEYLDAKAVSFWSGAKPESVSHDNAWIRLVDSCRQLADYAAQKGIVLGFEPEPGMFIETLADYERLKSAVDHPDFLLTLDVGHALVTESVSIPACIAQYRADIVNIHLEDMRPNRHEHLFFGDGDIDFNLVFQSLTDIRFNGPVCVELSRHSHQAVDTARSAMVFLSELSVDGVIADTAPPRSHSGA